jgi:hypothetical protein
VGHGQAKVLGAWQNELGAGKALEMLHSICKAIEVGYVEVPYRLGLSTIVKVLLRSLLRTLYSELQP